MNEDNKEPERFFTDADTDESVIAICVECFTEKQNPESDPFIRTGSGSGVCFYCGGPVVIASRSAVPGMRARRASGAKINP